MSTVAQKLGIKPGATVVVDGQPDGQIQALLGELPEGVVVSARTGAIDGELLAARLLEERAGTTLRSE